MKTAETKMEMIKDQVTSKIHWGATELEVREWLAEKHGISGDQADSMIDEAFRIRSKEIRGRAVIRLIFSSIGIAITAVFFLLPMFTGVIVVGRQILVVTICMIILAVVSVATFFRSLGQLFTGKTFGAVDK